MARIWALLTLVMLTSACTPSPTNQQIEGVPKGTQAESTASARLGANHALTIYGYNYTDRYIDDVLIDGQSAGNLDVSTPEAGGGKGFCCMGWRDGTPLPVKMHVKWVSGGCRYLSSPNQFGERFPSVQHFFKETDVMFNGPVATQPNYLEVHIYPDDRVEVAVTETWSPPRLKLNPDRAVDPYPEKCKPTP